MIVHVHVHVNNKSISVECIKCYHISLHLSCDYLQGFIQDFILGGISRIKTCVLGICHCRHATYIPL